VDFRGSCFRGRLIADPVSGHGPPAKPFRGSFSALALLERMNGPTCHRPDRRRASGLAVTKRGEPSRCCRTRVTRYRFVRGLAVTKRVAAGQEIRGAANGGWGAAAVLIRLSRDGPSTPFATGPLSAIGSILESAHGEVRARRFLRSPGRIPPKMCADERWQASRAAAIPARAVRDRSRSFSRRGHGWAFGVRRQPEFLGDPRHHDRVLRRRAVRSIRQTTLWAWASAGKGV